MQTRRVLCLTQPVLFRRPTDWDFHARYAVQRGRQVVSLPDGAWLVELEPLQTWPDEKTEYRYRLSSGDVLVLENPLPERSYVEMSDPRVITAMNAFRSLETILAEDFGLALGQTCRELSPFALIQCPLCAGASFTTHDLASAWCDRCNAAFQVRSTAGDPGFVVDVTWESYNPLAAHYILPRTDKLLSTLVLKDSGDPRDMSREHCSSECRSGPILLTDGSSGLRPGLHRCQVGTLYDWRRIYGRVPALEDLRQSRSWEIDGQAWPASTAIRTLSLDHSERQALELAAGALRKDLPNAAREIDDILRLRPQPPSVFEAVLPDVCGLKGDERYLLHHWLTMTSGNPPGTFETALPAWYVVVPVIEDLSLIGWEVTRRDICPWCGDPVAPQDFAADDTGRSKWELPHGHCREVWEKTGWQLPRGNPQTEEIPAQTQSPGGRP